MRSRDSPPSTPKAIVDAARDYVRYAEQLEARFLPKRTEVLSFGSGDCGQLAHSSTLEDENDTVVAKPRVVKALTNKVVAQLSCGGLHNVAVTLDGVCFTWGCNDEGSLGREGDESLLYMPGAVSLPEKVTCVAPAGPKLLQHSVRLRPGLLQGQGGQAVVRTRPCAAVEIKFQAPRLDGSLTHWLCTQARQRRSSRYTLAHTFTKNVTNGRPGPRSVALTTARCLTWGLGESASLVKCEASRQHEMIWILSEMTTDTKKSTLEKGQGFGVWCVPLVGSDGARVTFLWINHGQLGDGSTDRTRPV